MTGLELIAVIVLALIVSFTACAVSARVADVRIARHTGVDPRVDREAAKVAKRDRDESYRPILPPGPGPASRKASD